MIYRDIGDFLRCEPSARNTMTAHSVVGEVRSAVGEGCSGRDIAVSWYGIAGW